MFSGVSLLHRRKKSDSKSKKASVVAAEVVPAPVPAPAPNVGVAPPTGPTPKPTVDIAFSSVVGLSRSSASLGKPAVSPGVASQPGLDVPRIHAAPSEAAEGTVAAAWTGALANGDLSAMAGLLKGGGVVIDQEIDDEGHTGLMFAAQEGRDDIIRLLLNNRADMKRRDSIGRNALMWASTWGRESSVTLLLDRGAAVDELDNGGWTALMYAAHYGYDIIVERFLDTGAKYLTADRKLPSALQLASRNGFLGTVQKLIERYPQPEHLNWADFRGWSAVTEAAANGRLDVLRQLIDKGANADAADENRRNILHVASLRGHMDIVRFVLNMKFGMLNAVDAFNATPLMLALDQQRVEVANFLISKGADLTKQDREGYTPAHVATLAGLMDVLKMLRAVDKQVLESADYRGFTPLLLAVGQGNMEIVKYLLGEGVDSTCVDRLGRNAVMIASAAGHAQIVKFLVDRYPAMISLTDENCHPPLELTTSDGVKAILGPIVFPLGTYITERLDKINKKAQEIKQYDETFDSCDDKFELVRQTLLRNRPEKVLAFVTRALAASVTRPATDFQTVDPPTKKIEALLQRIAELENSDKVEEQVDSVRNRGRLLIMLNERILRKQEVADSLAGRVEAETRRPVAASIVDLQKQLANLDDEKAALAKERANYATQLEGLVQMIGPLKSRFSFPKDGTPELESLARFESHILACSEQFHDNFKATTQKLTEDVEMLNTLSAIMEVQSTQLAKMFESELDKDRAELDQARDIYDTKCNEVLARVQEMYGSVSKQFDDMTKQFETVNASNPMVEIRKSFLAALNKLEAEKAFHERLLLRVKAVREDVDKILPLRANGIEQKPIPVVAQSAKAPEQAEGVSAEERKEKYKSLFFFEQDTMAAAEGLNGTASASSLISAVLKAASCASLQAMPVELESIAEPVEGAVQPFSRGASTEILIMPHPSITNEVDPRSLTMIRGEIPTVFASSPNVDSQIARWEAPNREGSIKMIEEQQLAKKGLELFEH